MRFLILTILILTLFSCRKEATIWYSDWNVPIINDTLDLKNLTNDSTLAIYNGNYTLQFKRNILNLNPTELIKIPDTSIVQKFAISLPLLNIPPGTSIVNDNKDHFFNFGDAQLKNARIKSGKIVLTILNPIATNTFFEIELPRVTRDNVSLKKATTLTSGTRTNPSVKTLEFDLSDYFIKMTGSNGISSNALQSKLKIMSDPNGPSVDVSNLDSTEIRIQVKDLKFDYAQGYFGKISFSDTFSYNSKFLKNNVKGFIDFPAIDLKFNIENSIKIAANANLKSVKNVNTSTQYATFLSHPQIGNPFIIQNPIGTWNNLTPSKKTITFDQNNSNLENFIENLGDETTLSYDINLNPWGNINGGWDEFFPTSKINVSTEINMPLNIGFYDLNLLDTFNVNFGSNEKNISIESGNIVVKIENGFPFEGNLTLTFLNEYGQLIETIAPNKSIESSLFGKVNSNGVNTKYSEINLTLPVNLIEKLGEVKKIVASITLNSINSLSLQNEKVNIPENAFVWIKIQSALKTKNKID